MKTKVEFDTEYEEYSNEYNFEDPPSYITNVGIKDISLDCPKCMAFVSLVLNSVFIKNGWNSFQHDCDFQQRDWEFDVICQCPSCQKTVFCQVEFNYDIESGNINKAVNQIFPTLANAIVPEEVPKRLADDFREAVLVCPISPKASAALSRRILQDTLRSEFNIKHSSLAKEIDAFIQTKGIPPYITDDIDAIRNIGNFAAHPMKDTNTGEILPVEEGEAEWLLDVLKSLFEFRFVEPARSKARKDKLNKKLKAGGKPQLKS